MNDSSSRHLFFVFGLALGLLVLMSAMPWSSLTGNRIKDFNLFEDLFPSSSHEEHAIELYTDPELERILAEAAAGGNDNAQMPAAVAASADSCEADSGCAVPVAPVAQAPKAGGVVCIETYLPGGEMLPAFRQALASAATSTVRIAVIGDSFIEGDILTQNLRSIFQNRYGGNGVGFMAMHSDFPGFRKSVRQSDSGWTMHDIRSQKASDTLRTLSADYAVASAGAKTRFHGTDQSEHTSFWSRSSFMFIAPSAGTVTLGTSAGTSSFDVSPSDAPQWLSLDGETDLFTVATDIDGLVALGAYMDGDAGVQVDCMSVRGNSGVRHAAINAALCRSMALHADYSLIIVEFGMNALSAEQTDYTPYAHAMGATIRKLKEAYPHADILILGVSDRGVKNGTDIKSLSTCDAMVKAQRKLAADAGVHFWDTREAMGGPGAVVDWRRRHLMNADYIHLNHDGGREMASLLSESLFIALDE